MYTALAGASGQHIIHQEWKTNALGMVIRSFILFAGLVGYSLSCHAREDGQSSLFGYEGYLTVPSAFITDRGMSFQYSYLPQGVAPFYKGESDNWVFTGEIGFLPFVEMYLSVYVAPKVNWSKTFPNYGAIKVRSPGIKLRVVNEGTIMPALSIGFFDPSVGGGKGESVSSTFLVASKRFFHEKTSFSLGYGADFYTTGYQRLNGLWGGMSLQISDSIRFVGDYDGEIWSGGSSLRFRSWDIAIASIDGRDTAYSIGYRFILAK